VSSRQPDHDDRLAGLVNLVDRLQRENLELGGRVGFYQGRVAELEGRLKMLAAPKAEPDPPRRGWWRWW
jgi:hypothetical protein